MCLDQVQGLASKEHRHSDRLQVSITAGEQGFCDSEGRSEVHGAGEAAQEIFSHSLTSDDD